MTEDEAKTKWCPFSRSATNDDASINRPGTDTAEAEVQFLRDNTRCIASGCMAWRWRALNTGPREGCCGLAGAA